MPKKCLVFGLSAEQERGLRQIPPRYIPGLRKLSRNTSGPRPIRLLIPVGISEPKS